MEAEERQIIRENYLEQLHSKALAVCELLTEGKVLRTSLSLSGLTAREFYQARRDHQDVQKAYAEAQEILAELKLSDMDDMAAQLLTEEGMTVGTYTAITKNEKWAIEKLNPDRFGTRPNTTPTYVQNNVQVLQTLTDQQILDIVNGGAKKIDAVQTQPALTAENKSVDNTIEVSYKEVSGDVELDLSSSVCLHDDHHAAIPTKSSPAPDKPSPGAYDLSAFGDFK